MVDNCTIAYATHVLIHRKVVYMYIHTLSVHYLHIKTGTKWVDVYALASFLTRILNLHLPFMPKFTLLSKVCLFLY